MNFSCDCSDDSGIQPHFSVKRTRKARKPHECLECGVTIAPGETYEYVVGKWDDFETFSTCLGCSRIRQAFCSGGYIFGQLADQVSECIGFDYTEDPINLEEDPEEEAAHIEQARAEMARRRKSDA